jgi:hypothetical protein
MEVKKTYLKRNQIVYIILLIKSKTPLQHIVDVVFLTFFQLSNKFNLRLRETKSIDFFVQNNIFCFISTTPNISSHEQ